MYAHTWNTIHVLPFTYKYIWYICVVWLKYSNSHEPELWSHFGSIIKKTELCWVSWVTLWYFGRLPQIQFPSFWLSSSFCVFFCFCYKTSLVLSSLHAWQGWHIFAFWMGIHCAFLIPDSCDQRNSSRILWLSQSKMGLPWSPKKKQLQFCEPQTF